MRRDTELVLEGFPRSGNTFAEFAFRLAQPRPVRVAHHTHAPAQVLWAVGHRIPTILLIRRPADAVVSYVLREPYLPLHQALWDWIRFHRALVSVRRRLVVADFQQVTEDFGSVVTRLNSFYGTAFVPFRATEENVRKCFDMIEALHRSRRGGAEPDEMQVARPSAKRDLPRLALLERLSSARYGGSRDQADSLYAEFTLELTGTTGLA